MNFLEEIVTSKMKRDQIQKMGVLLYVRSELNPTDRDDFENSSFKDCKWVYIHVG